ncbi:hypothetical protein C1H84_00030 [Glutamicibacter soli]|uniref:Uncharacterized protein n=1 Tax=Glutamicibacter soli TaxID=453836 RepID=A0A365YM91_9MICC|nr:hypothetical protein C1H84_00030 [Glutamicibacter soli]
MPPTHAERAKPAGRSFFPPVSALIRYRPTVSSAALPGCRRGCRTAPHPGRPRPPARAPPAAGPGPGYRARCRSSGSRRRPRAAAGRRR